MRVSFSHYSMSVSRSTTNVDVGSVIGTIIVFKGAECTSGNVKRLRGSNHLRVVVKHKYCCRVESESLFSVALDQFR